jgi:hypothetical protein
LEFVLNFEKFDKPKTNTNISDWLFESFKSAKLKHSDINQLAADGASNAIGSMSEYESLSRTERANDVDFDVCLAHQNERSGGYASGTIKFAQPVNEELGGILLKNHRIQVHISRAPTRVKEFRDVQSARGRKPILLPDPAGETRWNGFIDETKRSNIIMGDLTETQSVLLGPHGSDRTLLTAEEITSNDLSRLNYTNSNKMVLRQFESAALPAKLFSKFTQDRRDTFSYMLFESRLAVSRSREETFTMHPGMYKVPNSIECSSIYLIAIVDISHMNRTVDLRARGERTVLVKKDSAMVTNDVEQDYSHVVIMDSCIEKYRDEYASDLEKRLSLNADKLTTAYAVSTLLNPVFGLEPKIVGSGLMTEGQYRHARSKVLSMMHDIMDKDATIHIASSSDDESNSSDDSDENVPLSGSSNYNKVAEEFGKFERFKMKKYLPRIEPTTSGVLQGEYNGKMKKLWIGKVEKAGKDLPSGRNLASYIDSRGRMKLLSFYSDHKKLFPTLFCLLQKEASRRVVEVGCERLFGLAGYVSSPRRTRLNVRTYERLSMLTMIIPSLYIDIDWVASEYMRRSKEKAWDQDQDLESVKCWNLERLIDAETRGSVLEKELVLEDLIMELGDE